MQETKIQRKPWFRALLIILAFIGLIILLGSAIIFSHPKPLRFYLEYLGKNSERGRTVSVYTREEFAKKYFKVINGEANNYDLINFKKLFRANFQNTPLKENNMFEVYKVLNKDNICQVNIYGLSKKKDLIYVSSKNICQKNENKY